MLREFLTSGLYVPVLAIIAIALSERIWKTPHPTRRLILTVMLIVVAVLMTAGTVYAEANWLSTIFQPCVPVWWAWPFC